MADNRGGYQRPSNPAPVSGVGKNSRRTDGRPNIRDLPDSQYGENIDYVGVQRAGAAAASAGGGGGMGSAPLPAPFTAPSTNPDVPITSGAEYGAGPGVGSLGLTPSGNSEDAAALRKYYPVIVKVADKPSISPATRRWARRVIAEWKG
jgi:hypothetical protein